MSDSHIQRENRKLIRVYVIYIRGQFTLIHLKPRTPLTARAFERRVPRGVKTTVYTKNIMCMCRAGGEEDMGWLWVESPHTYASSEGTGESPLLSPLLSGGQPTSESRYYSWNDA